MIFFKSCRHKSEEHFFLGSDQTRVASQDFFWMSYYTLDTNFKINLFMN